MGGVWVDGWVVGFLVVGFFWWLVFFGGWVKGKVDGFVCCCSCFLHKWKDG